MKFEEFENGDLALQNVHLGWAARTFLKRADASNKYPPEVRARLVELGTEAVKILEPYASSGRGGGGGGGSSKEACARCDKVGGGKFMTVVDSNDEQLRVHVSTCLREGDRVYRPPTSPEPGTRTTSGEVDRLLAEAGEVASSAAPQVGVMSQELGTDGGDPPADPDGDDTGDDSGDGDGEAQAVTSGRKSTRR